MVEGLKLYSEMEQLKQKLKLIENPLLRSVPPAAGCWLLAAPLGGPLWSTHGSLPPSRYVFGYQKNSNIQAKGIRPDGQKVTHVVSSSMMTGLLQSLLRDRLCQGPCAEDREVQVKGCVLLWVAFPF